MNMAKKIQKLFCALLAVAMIAVSFCALNVSAEEGEKAPAASPYLAEKLSYLETLYGDEAGTGVRVLARWAKANEDDFFDGDPNALASPDDMEHFVETIRYTIPIVTEYAVSPEFGNAAASMYHSMIVFEDLGKMIEVATAGDADQLTMVMLEVYPDFVNAIDHSFDASEVTSPENFRFLYAAVREKLSAEIAFDGEEKDFPTEKERDNAVLDAFYANYPDAEKTGLALFPQAFFAATFEQAVKSTGKDSADVIKAVLRSPVVFDDFALLTEVLLSETADNVIMKLSEIAPDLLSNVKKALSEEPDAANGPAAAIFTETLFRVSTACADLHGHTFGTPVYLYNAEHTECTAIAFCECGASVTETVKMTLENGKMTAVFADPNFETQTVEVITNNLVEDPEEKTDPIPLDPQTDPDEKETPANGLAITMTVLAAAFFLAAVAFAVLFFRGKKKTA